MRLRHFIYYLLYVIAVVALSLVIILAFHPHIGENTKPNNPATHEQTTTQANTSPVNSGAGSSSNAPATSSGNTSQPSTSSQAGGTQLTNTGPGDTAALFGVAMLAGSLGYRYYLLKKLKA